MIFARYLAREFLKIDLALLFIFLSFYVVADYLENSARYFVKYDVPGQVIMQYYVSQLPKIAIDSLPFTTLFASIVTLWMFSKHGEIAAIRAAGQSVLRLSLPLVVVGLGLSAVSFIVGEFFVPASQMRLRYVESVLIKHREYDPMFLESKWVKGSSGVLHFERFDPLEWVVYNPQYYVFSSASTVKLYAYSNRSLFEPNERKWIMENAVVTSFDRKGQVERFEFVPRFETSVSSEPPRLLREGITSDQLSYRELSDLIRLSRQSGGNLSNREVDLYQKLAMPFANLLFILLALPFALRKERQADTYLNVVLCLVAAVAYWVGNASMKSLAQNGLVNPLFAAWLVNGLFLVVTILIILKLDRGD